MMVLMDNSILNDLYRKIVLNGILGVSLKFSHEILINQHVGEKIPRVLFQCSTLLVCVGPDWLP